MRAFACFPQLGGQLSAAFNFPEIVEGADEGCPSSETITAQAVQMWKRAVPVLATRAIEGKSSNLSRAAGAASDLLCERGGCVAALVLAVGSRFSAPHAKTQIVQQYFGCVKQFPRV